MNDNFVQYADYYKAIGGEIQYNRTDYYDRSHYLFRTPYDERHMFIYAYNSSMGYYSFNRFSVARISSLVYGIAPVLWIEL